MQIINEKNESSVKTAINFLEDGKIIALNCETVYGLAVDASNPDAIDELYKLKGRDKNKPIVIFVKNIEIAKKIFKFDKKSLEIAQKFLPGNLTLILMKNPKNPYKLAGNLNQNDNFLGFRIVKNEFIQNLLERFNGILAVTSANISSEKNTTNISEVKDVFQNSEILLIDGGESKEKIASTIIKIYDNNLKILRKGPISIKNSELSNK